MLGDNIKNIRTQRKLSINKLSSLSGVSLGYISDLENNNVSNPTVDKLQKIADALNVPIESLFKKDSVLPSEEETTIKEASDIFKVDPDMLITMCRAKDLPEEERKKIREYSALLIEKHLREQAKKKLDDK